LVWALFSCSDKKKEISLPYYNTPSFTPEFFSSATDATQKITHTIPAFSFTNQHGKEITEKAIEGKVHVANFIFTRCGSICPVMTRHMKLVQDAFKSNQDVALLSFSVTPWIDSVQRLQAYASNNEITAPNWHLLTGDKGAIYNLARRSYFAEEDMGFTKDSTDFLHTEHILLVDKSKRIRGIYNGTLQLEVAQLVKDITVLLKQ
jgi:protein SCO1